MSESPQPPQGSGSPAELPAEPAATAVESPAATPEQSQQKPPSYVKLAMRNMVRKRGKSLYHFTLTTLGLLAVLVGLAYLTR